MATWAFLSDIHGNDKALERAVAIARARSAQRFAFLGDLLGRGRPDRCVAMARDLADLSVVGNRDLDWRDRVDEVSRDYVLSLPRSAAAADFLALHGDSALTEGLGSGDLRAGLARAHRRLTADGYRALFFGHTHHARVWRKDGPDRAPVLIEEARIRLDPAPGRIYVVNVGTVGRPFPGKGPASFVLYEPETGYLERVPL